MRTTAINLNRLKPVILFLLLITVISQPGERSGIRPAKWAQPVTGTSLKNFFIVDSMVFRSSQPGKDDFHKLEKLGIKEVLNLRQYSSDNKRAKGTNLILNRVEMSASDIELSEVIEALKVIKNSKGKLLVHCRHGSDRTGLICAMYRIVFQNWTKDEAIDEMVNGGFGFHKMYKGIIEFIKNADVEKIKVSLT